jgi:hypothetical protein
LDDRGHPDQTSDYDWLETSQQAPPFVRKTRPLPDEIDPSFDVKFNEAIHGEYLRTNLKTDHLPSGIAQQLTDLIKKYWCVFDPEGVGKTIIGYECSIDTGDAKPISCKNINYGPRESAVIMQHLTVLEKIRHIEQIYGSEWLFKIILAPKPHQEHIYDIADFVWRLCVNFIPLNEVTRVIAFPAVRCDTAVGISFGDGEIIWLLDCPQGYHQVIVRKCDRDKLAFAGPNGTIWRYRVMPFGPVNGPAIFIGMMLDICQEWQHEAVRRGLVISESLNTRIIVDDLFNFAPDYSQAFTYLESQLYVAARRRVTFKLSKSDFFVDRLEFVGVDVSNKSIYPASSKYELINSWPRPTIRRDVYSFIHFGLFYSKWIPYFEVNIQPLRALCIPGRLQERLPPSDWTDACETAWQFIITSITSDPCLARFDPSLRSYLSTDFCAIGMGFCLSQPNRDPISIAAMEREIAGGECEFLRDPQNDQPSPALRPVSFGSRMCKGYECQLHSHLGEIIAGDWGANKCRIQLWGIRNTWVTDCYAVKFLLAYDGDNGILRRWQMRLMMMHLDVIHRNAKWLGNADYLSRFGGEIHYDPLISGYEAIAAQLRKNHAAPIGPLLPQNMPGFRKRRASKSPRVSSAHSDGLVGASDHSPTLLDELLYDDAEPDDSVFALFSHLSMPLRIMSAAFTSSRYQLSLLSTRCINHLLTKRTCLPLASITATSLA